jgi:hypothetical protein
MTRIPDLERALHRAAQRLEHPSPTPTPSRGHKRWRLPLLATISTLAIAGGAIAATGVLEEGDPVPASPRMTSTLGEITPGTTRLVDVRAPDPDGGIPWTIRIFRTRDGQLACTQVGRTQNGQLGAIGRYGAFRNDGRFHRVAVTSVQNMSCGGLPKTGALRGTGLTTVSASGAAARSRNGADPSDTRVVRYGFAGPDAVRVELRAGAHQQSMRVNPDDSGAYLLVTRGDIDTRDATLEVVYQDGVRCLDFIPRPNGTPPTIDPRCDRLRTRAQR